MNKNKLNKNGTKKHTKEDIKKRKKMKTVKKRRENSNNAIYLENLIKNRQECLYRRVFLKNISLFTNKSEIKSTIVTKYHKQTCELRPILIFYFNFSRN